MPFCKTHNWDSDWYDFVVFACIMSGLFFAVGIVQAVELNGLIPPGSGLSTLFGFIATGFVFLLSLVKLVRYRKDRLEWEASLVEDHHYIWLNEFMAAAETHAIELPCLPMKDGKMTNLAFSRWCGEVSVVTQEWRHKQVNVAAKEAHRLVTQRSSLVPR